MDSGVALLPSSSQGHLACSGALTGAGPLRRVARDGCYTVWSRRTQQTVSGTEEPSRLSNASIYWMTAAAALLLVVDAKRRI